MQKEQKDTFDQTEDKVEPSTDQNLEKELAHTNFSSFERWIKPKKFNVHYPNWVSSRMLMSVTCFYASLGDFLFGFDQGIMAGLLVNPVFISKFFAGYISPTGVVDPQIEGITVACVQVTSAISAMSCSRLCDMIGRRACMQIGATLYLISGFIEVFAPNLACFIVGRTLVGFGVGFLSMTVPVIQTEIASLHRRGMMVGIEFSFNIIGYSLSCWLDFAFYSYLPSSMSWQGPYIFQMSVAVLMLVLSLIVPETPRWLAANGFPRESAQTVANLHGNGNLNNDKVVVINTEVREAVLYERRLGTASWKEMFTVYWRRTFMACTGQMFAQLNGVNVISFYLASSLSSAGFSQSKSLLYTGANSVVYIFATIPTWWLADKWGRKPILIFGGLGMMVALCITCLFAQLPSLAPLERANGIFAFVVIYNALFGFSWGPVPWLLPAEVFPLRARAKGMSLATVSNWLFNFLVAMTTPSAFQTMQGYYYVLIAGFCLISAVMVFFLYKETAKHTLEELSTVFGDRAFEHEETTMEVKHRLEERKSSKV